MQNVRFAALTLVLAMLTAANTPDLAGAQVPRSGLPGVKSIESVHRFVMPDVDVPKLLAEDLVREGSGVPVVDLGQLVRFYHQVAGVLDHEGSPVRS